MNTKGTEIYHSSNGDSWKLRYDESTQTFLVRHVPNPSSGGTAKEMSADEFLFNEGSGPEYRAIRQAIKAWPLAAAERRPAGFYWVRGQERSEPAYWDGERWSMLSAVTEKPIVISETPIRYRTDHNVD